MRNQIDIKTHLSRARRVLVVLEIIISHIDDETGQSLTLLTHDHIASLDRTCVTLLTKYDEAISAMNNINNSVTSAETMTPIVASSLTAKFMEAQASMQQIDENIITFSGAIQAIVQEAMKSLQGYVTATQGPARPFPNDPASFMVVSSHN